MTKLELIQNNNDELLKIEHETFGSIKQYTIDAIEKISGIFNYAIEEISYSEDTDIIEDVILDISGEIYYLDTLLEICDKNIKDYEVLKHILNMLEKLAKDL